MPSHLPRGPLAEASRIAFFILAVVGAVLAVGYAFLPWPWWVKALFWVCAPFVTLTYYLGWIRR